MSHVAIGYAKELTKAPDGSKITATEKAVLMMLADWHNEEVGTAWPSMKLLAKSCCISDRHCRRMIERLERKRVIRRNATRRTEDGGQSSNEYVFLALEKPVIDSRLVEKRRKLQHTPRIPMSGKPGHKHPTPPDTYVREGRTKSTGGRGHGNPPIEPVVESLGDSSSNKLSEPNTPISPSQASGELVPDLPCSAPPHVSLQLVRIGLGAAIEAVHGALIRLTTPAFEKRDGFRNGAVEWQEFRFGDLALESYEVDRVHGLVLTVSSPEPTLTALGLVKYKARWDKALLKALGRPALLKLRE